MDAPQSTPPPFDPFLVGPWMEAVRRSWELWFEMAFPLAARPRPRPAAGATSPTTTIAAVPAAPTAPTGPAPSTPPTMPATPARVASAAPASTPAVAPAPTRLSDPEAPRPVSLDDWVEHLIEVRRRGLLETGRYVIPKTLLAEASAATGEAETRLIRLVNSRDPDHEGAALDPEAQRALEDRVLGAAVAEITAHRQRSGRTEIPPEVLAATAAELRRSPARTRRLLLQRLYGEASAASTPSTGPYAGPSAEQSNGAPPVPARRHGVGTRARGARPGRGGGLAGRRRPAAATRPADRDELGREFRELVNMSPAKLERWLDTDASKAAGPRRGAAGAAAGQAAGRRVLEIRRKRKTDLTDDDLAHMRKAVSYIKRHRDQRPEGDVTDSRWRHSLMNWGHDPLAS